MLRISGLAFVLAKTKCACPCGGFFCMPPNVLRLPEGGDFGALHYQTATLFIKCSKVQIYQIAPHYVYLLLGNRTFFLPSVSVGKDILFCYFWIKRWLVRIANGYGF